MFALPETILQTKPICSSRMIEAFTSKRCYWTKTWMWTQPQASRSCYK